MKNDALNTFTTALEQIWGPLTSSLTHRSKQLLEQLTKDCINEEWIKALIANKDSVKEIYRSKAHGFVLMGHVEQKGDISPPHDHGNGWVLYSTVEGAVEMGIFNKIITADGQLNLIQKDQYELKPGECSVYLPGDIHDTTSLQDNTIMLRLTSCDFMEELSQGRLIRYMNSFEKW